MSKARDCEDDDDDGDDADVNYYDIVLLMYVSSGRAAANKSGRRQLDSDQSSVATARD